jgi:hypothetical protein
MHNFEFKPEIATT